MKIHKKEMSGPVLNVPSNALFIIDGSSFLYRSFYALKPLTAPDGTTVQAVYGFCRMLKKLINQYNPHFLVLTWDSYGKTVRHEIYEQYKAGRMVAPLDLAHQKKLVMEFADLVGIKQYIRDATEADDLIFSLALKAQSGGTAVVIVSSDKDLRQIVAEHVFVLDPFLDRLLDRAAIEQMYGFPPERLSLYFSLLGDSSDNIPGVRGIGQKSATELASQYATLDDLYMRLDLLKPKIKNLLEASREQAFLSLKLFLLRTVPVEYVVDTFAFDAVAWRNAQDFFQRLGFSSLLKDPVFARSGDTGTSFTGVVQPVQGTLELIQTHQALDALGQKLAQTHIFALDTETTGADPFACSLVGISICCEDDRAYYIPCAHQTTEPQLPLALILDWLRPFCTDTHYRCCLHNAKFDMHVLHGAGVDMQSLYFDTMIAAYLLAEEGQSVGLKNLSARFLGQTMQAYGDVVEKAGYATFDQVPLAAAVGYAAADALQTWRLWKFFEPMLAERGLSKIFFELEIPCMYTLVAMEREGIAVSKDVVESNACQLDRELVLVVDQLRGMLGPGYDSVNFNSPKQLQHMLFVDLGLKPVKKTSGGKSLSTDQEALMALVDQHPVVPLIIKYRELAKLASTYGRGLLAFCNAKTGKIHSSFSQIRAATGRLASSEPNMQNIPVGTEAGVSIRSAFVPPAGYVLLSADYSQIELRVLAHLSGDQCLLDAFAAGKDIHAITATGLFCTPIELVTREQRQVAKVVNFGILYGLTAFRLSKDLGIPYQQAQEFHDRFWKQYPGVVAWIARLLEDVRKNGFVTTWYGRRRMLPGIYESNKALYQAAVRVATNMPCQGTAAELIKKGMINLHAALIAQSLDARMVLQIHDELVLVVNQDQVDAVERLTKQILQSVEPSWQVPLTVSTRVGANWHEVSK